MPGPITYVVGNLTFNSWAKDDNLKVNGMLIVNGNVSFNCGNCELDVSDPGTGKAGIFANGNISDTSGALNVDGVVYSSGSSNYNNSQTVMVNGGILSGGSMSLNTGAQVTFS